MAREQRRVAGVPAPAWLAGVEFGRLRREPTSAEREVWRACGRIREFNRGVRHGRTLSPRGEQTELALCGVA
jgi:hypothetical protein